MVKKFSPPFPVLLSKEGAWHIAACPPLDIATQGKTDQEVRKNMRALISEYLRDPDTRKNRAYTLDSTSLTYMSVPIPTGPDYGEA